MQSKINIINVGDIVQEVNYIAYFNAPMKPKIGIVLKIYKHKSNPSVTYTHEIAKVHWLKSSNIEAIPVYLLKHYEIRSEEYECEKI